MTRILRCIGGPHDGEPSEVRDRGYVQKVRFKRESLPIPFMSTSLPDPVASVSAVETLYTVRKFRIGPDPVLDAYEFLAPVDMSDRDAFLFQFAK